MDKMDQVGKRVLFFQVVGVLQVAKFYQWFFHNWTWQTIGFWQWMILDVAVLVYASRKGLRFPVSAPLVFLILILSAFVVNAAFAHSAVRLFFPPLSQEKKGKKIPTVTLIRQYSSLFPGRHLPDYSPWGEHYRARAYIQASEEAPCFRARA